MKDNVKRMSVCPYKKECGGCDYQGIEYKKQLELKQKEMNLLFGEFERKGAKLFPIIGADNPYYYRNKVHGIFAVDKQKIIYTGIYAKQSHKVINVSDCQIENEVATNIMKSMPALLKSFKYTVYDEDRQTGLFRHVLIRTGKDAKGKLNVMLVFVLSSQILPSKNNFVKAILRLHPEISTIVLNVNDKKTTMVLGSKNIILYGKGYIEDTLCGLTFRISPSAFFQINPVQTEVLYNKAMEYAKLTGKERIIDAYCGTGTIGMALSQNARQVLGIELNKDAVRDAIANAKNNEIKNVIFECADAGDYMSTLAMKGEKYDVVIMDPPRSGSTDKFIQSVKKLSPERVVYVSCAPDTLKIDLKVFEKNGYSVLKIQPVDMFPFTSHVETVVLLTRQNT